MEIQLDTDHPIAGTEALERVVHRFVGQLTRLAEARIVAP